MWTRSLPKGHPGSASCVLRVGIPTGCATICGTTLWRICGWTDYHMVACASGRVQQAALSADGIYTVDIEMDAEGGSFTVENGAGQFEDGIDKPNYMRAEIFANVVAATHDLPRTNERVTICGALFWDGDGFLEIHPRRAEDITILQHD